jgi:hypothetical protein
MAVAPGNAHLRTIKILHHDNFLPSIKPCIATLVMLNKNLYHALLRQGFVGQRWQKVRPRPVVRGTAYPPCTVTVFRLKYQYPARCCRRVTSSRQDGSPLSCHNMPGLNAKPPCNLAPRYPYITCRDLTLGHIAGLLAVRFDCTLKTLRCLYAVI